MITKYLRISHFLAMAMAIAVALGCARLYAGPGEETSIEFDPGQTKVHFTLAGNLHTVHGEFKLRSGVVRFDAASGEASGSLVIDPASGDSGNGSRDGRMKDNILEVRKYPSITFTPRHVNGPVALQGDSKVEVQGTFNLHGSDHPLTLVAQLHAHDGAITANVRFVVPYVKWGLKNPSMLFLRVDDKVDLDIHAVGRVAAPNSSR